MILDCKSCSEGLLNNIVRRLLNSLKIAYKFYSSVYVLE